MVPSMTLADDGFARAFRETMLAWDDGAYNAYDHRLTGHAGDMLAVMFRAPHWANTVVRVYYHTANDSITHPVNPDWPTTKAFLATFWKPDSSPGPHPAGLAMAQAETDSMYDEDTWIEYVLPMPLDISDPQQFPERQFFVGLEWLHDLNPYLMFDASAPLDEMGWTSDGVTWYRYEDGDIMIRAIVSDSLGASPVQPESWGIIKSQYLDSGVPESSATPN
jgi:hypothetical protein